MRTQLLCTLVGYCMLQCMFQFASPSSSHAQTSPTATVTPTPTPGEGTVLTTEGVSGDVDKKRREPVLSVRSVAGIESTTLYADAYVTDGEFQKYPIQFDFYINRTLFSSQVRSIELPGPVGITVNHNQIPIPFNYTVIARVLHPNRVFTTVLNAAVEEVTPTPVPGLTLNCTYTDDAGTYTNESVSTSESSGVIENAFTGTDSDNSQVQVAFKGTESGSDLSGTLTVTYDQEPATMDVTGTFTKTGDRLTSFTVQAAPGEIGSLECK